MWTEAGGEDGPQGAGILCTYTWEGDSGTNTSSCGVVFFFLTSLLEYNCFTSGVVLSAVLQRGRPKRTGPEVCPVGQNLPVLCPSPSPASRITCLLSLAIAPYLSNSFSSSRSQLRCHQQLLSHHPIQFFQSTYCYRQFSCVLSASLTGMPVSRRHVP